jgi:uncharacterized protein YeaO (DUF488 family)
MPEIAIKRVYDEPAKRDGQRILVDRLWPRGVTKEAAALDNWNKDLAPSPTLREWFGHASERFAEFKDRYEAELAKNPAVTEFLSSLKQGKTALLYGAKDPEINHAIILAAYLRKRAGRKAP